MYTNKCSDSDWLMGTLYSVLIGWLCTLYSVLIGWWVHCTVFWLAGCVHCTVFWLAGGYTVQCSDWLSVYTVQYSDWLAVYTVQCSDWLVGTLYIVLIGGLFTLYSALIGCVCAGVCCYCSWLRGAADLLLRHQGRVQRVRGGEGTAARDEGGSISLITF